MHSMTISVVGTGKIANEVLQALQQHLPEIKITAVCTRPQSLEHTQAFAEKYHINKVYTDFDQMLLEDNADFVYLANVNSVHFDYAHKALLKKRNVIVEKPICTYSWQTEELIRLASQNEAFLFEAITMLHLPNLEVIRSLLPTLGRIHIVYCNYSQYSSRYDRYLQHEVAPAFDPQLEGGALNDINIYNLFLLAALFGQPVEYTYHANKGYNGIDTSGIMNIRYSDFLATCIGAKDCGAPSGAMIQGEKGWLKIEGPVSTLQKMTICYNGEQLQVIPSQNKYENRLCHEFESIERIFHSNDFKTASRLIDTSLIVTQLLEGGKSQTV